MWRGLAPRPQQPAVHTHCPGEQGADLPPPQGFHGWEQGESLGWLTWSPNLEPCASPRGHWGALLATGWLWSQPFLAWVGLLCPRPGCLSGLSPPIACRSQAVGQSGSADLSWPTSSETRPQVLTPQDRGKEAGLTKLRAPQVGVSGFGQGP